MKIALFCSTHRGLRFYQRIVESQPHAELIVCSFEPEPFEPQFLLDIKDFADSHKHELLLWDPKSPKKSLELWANRQFDLLFAVNWRYKISDEIYSKANLGAYILHDSLLPIYRGFSPTVWAIVNGEDHTGVTLFKIAEEIDSGDIITQKKIPIGPDEMIDSVMEKVTQGYLEILDAQFPNILQGKVKAYPQDQTKATFTCKRLTTDNKIQWHQSSTEIFNLIRGVSHPYPGAYCQFQGSKLTVWSAERIQNPKKYVGNIPGRVVEIIKNKGIIVLTGDASLLIKTVQLENQNETCSANLISSLSCTLE
jgi:methionyl-tRNA formyltransferase